MKGYWSDVKKLAFLFCVSAAGIGAAKGPDYYIPAMWAALIMFGFAFVLAGIAHVLPGYKRTDEGDE